MSDEPVSTFPPAGGKRNWSWLVLVLGAGAALLILHRFNPVEYGFYPRCELHRLTGLHCPGCGSQRALHALTHGDFAAALRANALLILGAPAALVLWFARRSSSPAARKDAPPPLPGVTEKFWVKWIVVAVLVFTLARNLPFTPFHWLAP